MQVNDMEIAELQLDNQTLYLPTTLQWAALIEQNPVIDGHVLFRYIGFVKHVAWNLAVMARYKEPVFAVAFYRPVPSVGRSWSLVNVMRSGDEGVRFYFEKLTCRSCGWKGHTANPTISDLFIGVQNKHEVSSEIYDQAKLPCPRCGGKLPRPAIWTEGADAQS